MNNQDSRLKTFSPGKAFTTEPQQRKIVTWHKLKSVRTRVCALQESFYPTKDVAYAAVKTRMATLLGICDRMSVLAYLGRPECTSQSVLEQTVRYVKSGATVPKKHYFRRKLVAKKGTLSFSA